MTLSLGDWKLKLIEEILQLKEEQSLRKIEQEIKSLREAEKKAAQLKSIFKPIRPSISVKEMKKEQAYQPIKKNAFYKKAAKLKIEEPLDELLSMLD